MKIAEAIQAKQDRKFMKELRKLKKLEMIEEYQNSESRSIVDNKAFVDITLLALLFSLIIAFIDLDAGILAGACVIGLNVTAIFIEALIQSIFECVSEFIHMNFTADRERRRAYNQTKKVIRYAINNDRLSDEQITVMIQGLVSNARDEQKKSSISTINFDKVYCTDKTDEEREAELNESLNEIYNNVISNTTAQQETVAQPQETKAGKYSLVFNASDISIMNGSQEIEKVTYDEIQQPTSKEEIASMPYSTIYGYVTKENKTIYIDMEQEVAIIK